MDTMITLTINELPVEVPRGTSILEAAKQLGLTIPTLCHHEDLCVAGNCRVCVVEQQGSRLLVAACSTPVTQGMVIFTNTARVRQARKHIIELLLSEHDADCTRCYRNGSCELQALAVKYRLEGRNLLELRHTHAIDLSSPAIVKDDGKCIRCQRCVRTCSQIQGVNALTVAHKGEKMRIETFCNLPLDRVFCTTCGQCVAHCPTGALVEKTSVEQVWSALGNPKKHVVVQTAPAVRVALGEEFGLEPGTRVTGRMVTALRRLGFHAVFDTNFTADLTIIEEGNELLSRLTTALGAQKGKAVLPMATSCSPGWIRYMEFAYPDLLEHLSTCKSPQQMFGAVAKTYYAQQAKVDPATMVVVSVMPCTAKKSEADRPEMRSSGFKDVDYVLTTRELALMIHQAGIDFAALPEGPCDSLLGTHSGAGVIFGATGGVMEAALRTAYELVTGREVPFTNLEILPVRGMEGVREATLPIRDPLPAWNFLEGVDLRVAIAHGLTNAKKVMDQVRAGTSPYHFIEVMTCPGGCLGGGGQPIPTTPEIRRKRAEALYAEDRDLPVRKSHNNPQVQELYANFLKKPLGERSHALLHTHYHARERIGADVPFTPMAYAEGESELRL
ncbi:MAG: ferredoxin [Deltaproteobacteria bacterium RIFOXYA12_FULL_61_11]|nr:MAG: ferredoxin [Deltaproteobacteria bacterium RIFOXYA12_FULL_61_11]